MSLLRYIIVTFICIIAVELFFDYTRVPCPIDDTYLALILAIAVNVLISCGLHAYDRSSPVEVKGTPAPSETEGAQGAEQQPAPALIVLPKFLKIILGTILSFLLIFFFIALFWRGMP